MKKRIALSIVILVFATLCFAKKPKQTGPVEVVSATPKTPQAQALLNYIATIYNEGKTIAGQMDLTWAKNIDMAQEVYDDVGRYPALMGYDFMNYTGSHWNESTQTEEALEWGTNAKGTGKAGIVAFCWHWRDPLTPPNSIGEFYKDKTKFKIPYKSGGLMEETEEFKAIKRDLDIVAGELQKLKDAGVPILWRPMHEAAGDPQYNNPWFWWGASGKEAYLALYRYMHDYFTKEKGLDNLIWVWNAQNIAWYPGDEYCDIIAWDEYSVEKFQTDYYALKNMRNGKIIALSENGRIPENPWGFWAYFMTWNDSGDAMNDNEKEDFWSNERINPIKTRKKIYGDKRTITLDKLDLVYPKDE